MSASNAQPAKQGFAELTEDEAEAVLLALGPRLEWNVWGDALIPGPRGVSARKSSHVYIVTGRSFLFFRWHMVTHIVRAGEQKPRRLRFKSESAAKAACERHHATGKWE